MQLLVLTLHILVAASLIGLVLLQRGKGSDVGAAFGSGASTTMFGSQGSTPFLVKLVAVLAVIFFGTSLLLGHFASHQVKKTDEIILPADSKAPKSS